MLFLPVVKDFDFFAKMKIQFKRGMVHWRPFLKHFFVLALPVNASGLLNVSYIAYKKPSQKYEGIL